MILSENNPQLAAKLDLHILYKQRNKAEQSTCPTSLANRESSWTVRQPAWWSLLSCSAAKREFTMANIVATSVTSSSARQASVLGHLDPTTSFSSDFSIKRANKLPNHTSSSVFSIQRAQKLFNLTSPSEFSLQRAKQLPNLTSSSSNLPRLTVISCSTSLVEKV